MTQAFVVMQVDADDTIVLGVAADITKAREIALTNATMYVDAELSDVEAKSLQAAVDRFDENMLAADNIGAPGGLDTQFESGFGSWDYRIVKTEAVL